MTRITFPLSVLAIALVGLLHAVPAQADPIRVFVALTGSDANPCTFASPCKSVQHAHDVVAAGGEVRMLDPGSYGLLIINKSISILGDGHGGIAAQSGAVAITINAGATDKINLRGVVLEGFGTGNRGIVFNTGASLNIQDSIIRNFTNGGIYFAPTAVSELSVLDTLISDNGGHALEVHPLGSGSATGVVDRVRTVNSTGDGMAFTGTGSTGPIVFTVSDSVSANNTNYGIIGTSSAGTIIVLIENCTMSNNAFVGVNATGSAATLLVARSRITGNAVGWSVLSGATLSSYGDNYVDGNGGNGSPSGTIVLH